MNMVLSVHICRRHSGSIRAIQRENNRTIDDRYDFPLSDINWDKTPENVFLIRSDGWLASIKSELSDHGIDGYRKNAVLLFDVIYSASADFFEKNEPETITAFFDDCLRFHDSEFGHVINAVVHYDETTPHLHVVSVPIVERENGFALCARELIRENRNFLLSTIGCFRKLAVTMISNAGSVLTVSPRRSIWICIDSNCAAWRRKSL